MIFGAHVRSKRDPNLEGTIVGKGFIRWPEDPNGETHGDLIPMLVFLVRVQHGSNCTGPACVVMRSDQVEFIWDNGKIEKENDSTTQSLG